LTFLSSDHVVVWVIQSSGNMGAENISANASVCGCSSTVTSDEEKPQEHSLDGPTDRENALRISITAHSRSPKSFPPGLPPSMQRLWSNAEHLYARIR
jgi:hypothetical protein